MTTLTRLIENHRTAVAAIADWNASDAAHVTERNAAEAFIRYVPLSLKEVKQKAKYASGKTLTVEDKLKALHRLTWC